jgi:23S rRNA pseudouridine2457 synthase
MVSQFISSHPVRLLKDIDFDFPEGTHAIGRLDSDSEGLLILTTNKKITRLLFQGEKPHLRKYLVQVKHLVTPATLALLQNGVTIKIKGGQLYTTPPCEVMIVPPPDHLFSSGLQLRDDVPHTWLTISLTEGKYHQVRKMVAAVQHKCKRLIRLSIEDLVLGNLLPGEVKEMEEAEFFKLLHLKQ